MSSSRWSLGATWPFWTLGLLAVVFVLMLGFSRKAPVIAALDPAMAAPGDLVTVTGDYFGRTAQEGTLDISGEIPPPSLIKSWSDQKIVFQIPEDAVSGLVTVANSQGVSQGVLFTNTLSIPTVLRSAVAQGEPLVLSLTPAQPVAGSLATVGGRGLGTGDEPVLIRLAVRSPGAVFEIGPAESLSWSDRAVTFRWPAGAGPETTIQVVTARGTTPAVFWGGSGPVALEAPRTLEVNVVGRVSVAAGVGLTLWGPVPQRLVPTSWKLVSAEPAPLSGVHPLNFRFVPGPSGERLVSYRLALTSYTHTFEGPPSGASPGGPAPQGDARIADWWQASAPVLKTLTAKWQLETPDPWLRVQRIQAGMKAAFQFHPASAGPPGVARTPAIALVSRTLDSYEASSLAAYLAGKGGIPVRLVSGLWDDPAGPLVPRIWAEFWLAGAGWVSWDVLDGNPGTLDNRHFGFEALYEPPVRWEPRSKTFGPAAPGSLGTVGGEVQGSGTEPVVRWEITRVEK